MPFNPPQGLNDLRSAMFTKSQMQQVEEASRAISGDGRDCISPAQLQQVFEQVGDSSIVPHIECFVVIYRA